MLAMNSITSISKKLVLAISLTIFIIFTVGTIVLTQYLAAEREAQVHQQINTRMNTSAQQIEQFFANKIRALHTLFRSPNTLETLINRTDAKQPATDIEGLSKALAAESGADSEILSIFFGSAITGEYFFEKGIYNTDGYSVYGRPWWEEIKKTQKIAISEVQLHPSYNKNYSAINFPVSHQGKFIGVGGADIFVPSLSRFIDELQFQNHGYAFLIDGQGRTIHFSASSELKLNQPFSELDNSSGNDGFNQLMTNPKRLETLSQVTLDGKPYQVAMMDIPHQAFTLDWQIGLLVPQQVIDKPVYRSIYQVIALALLLLVLLSLTVGVITRKLCKPLSDVQVALDQIAKGNGDLTQRIKIKGKDETAKVGHAVNNIISHLQEMVGKIIGSTQELDKAITYVEGLSQESAQTNQSMRDNMDTTVNAVSELATSAENIKGQADTAQQAVNAANSMAVEGQALITENQAELNLLTEQFTQANQVVDKLRVESDGISEVLDVIKSVAEQTNLLALNAAIEAARAGENGRGFAVVADEVRQLAARSESSTNQIQKIIEQLQTSSEKASSMMAQSTEKLSYFENHSLQLSSSFSEISDQVNHCVAANASITEQVSMQAQTSNELDQLLHTLQDEVTEQMARSNEIATCQTQLANASHNLAGEVTNFKVN